MRLGSGIGGRSDRLLPRQSPTLPPRCGAVHGVDAEGVTLDGERYLVRWSAREKQRRGKTPKAAQNKRQSVRDAPQRIAKLVHALHLGETLTSKSIRDRFGVSRATAKRDLHTLETSLPVTVAKGPNRTVALTMSGTNRAGPAT